MENIAIQSTAAASLVALFAYASCRMAHHSLSSSNSSSAEAQNNATSSPDPAAPKADGKGEAPRAVDNGRCQGPSAFNAREQSSTPGAPSTPVTPPRVDGNVDRGNRSTPEIDETTRRKIKMVSSLPLLPVTTAFVLGSEWLSHVLHGD